MRLLTLLACLLSAVLSGPTLAATDKYYAPPGQVSITLQVMELGLANVTALFREATASFQYDKDSTTLSRFRLAIDPASLISTNRRNEQDLATMLGTQEIAFVASDPVTLKDGKGQLKGTLSLNGVSKPAQFDAVLNKLGENSNNGLFSNSSATAGLTLRGTIKKADFNIADQTDTPRYGTELTLTADVQAIGQN